MALAAPPPILNLSSASVVPLFIPPSPSPSAHAAARPCAPVALSRWNPDPTAAPPAVRRRRLIAALESSRRRDRRFDCAIKVSSPPHSPPSPLPTVHFKSNGSPSSRSAPSLPGRRSKYSKPERRPDTYPEFRRDSRSPTTGVGGDVRLSEKGLTYHVDGAPFEFQYSYTEMPKVKPLGLREPAYLPFGPQTMPRPWTGRKPLPGTKKLLPEFDSFVPPPAGKKGVKPVQAPGPFLAGEEPRYHAKSREDILGEPLSKEEVDELVKGSLRVRRQLNMGRDGLTHNMLENIHAHWKRRRVCKIKCIGVCTVDLDNVCQQLEEKVGGKVIYRRGGVIFLFRGRYYNYKTRPRFPLMLWKPATPVYPRLVKQAPEGLTLEEAKEMRKIGRQLPPICRLAKNGLYSDLVRQVKEAFEACELVRVDCKGLNKSDCRKVGAKLKDLVPCVLLSFEYEHILMWRGKDWKSSLVPLEDHPSVVDSNANGKIVSAEDDTVPNVAVQHIGLQNEELGCPISTGIFNNYTDGTTKITEQRILSVNVVDESHGHSILEPAKLESPDPKEMVTAYTRDDPENFSQDFVYKSAHLCRTSQPEQTADCIDKDARTLQPKTSLADSVAVVNDAFADQPVQVAELSTNMGLVSKASSVNEYHGTKPLAPQTEVLLLLLKKAVESNIAVVLDDNKVDADLVYQESVALAKTVPQVPKIERKTKKTATVEKVGDGECISHNVPDIVDEVSPTPGKNFGKKMLQSNRKDELPEIFSGVLPQGSLGVDELAKLLA